MGLLLVMSFALGLTATVAQDIVPAAVTLTRERERERGKVAPCGAWRWPRGCSR